MKTQNTCFALAVLLAIAVLGLALAEAPGWAQNVVPPTAREAAASPKFAAKLHPRATAQAAGKSSASARTRTRRALPQDAVIYENGPVNGNTDAWTINFGYVVADSFTVGGGDTVTGFDFWIWEFPGDSLSSVDWSITSAPFGGTTYASGTASGSNLTDTYISTNSYGYNIDQISASGLNVFLNAGTYYLNLANASVPSGDPVYWDENSGTGCNSPGCPSLADESAAGTIPSEAFDVTGSSSSSEPPNPPCLSSGGSMQIIYDFDEDGGYSEQGVAINWAGNLFGTTGTVAYELSPKGQDWVFTSLYPFFGGSGGSSPSPVIVGPDAALYGTAAGGIQNCHGNYCGLVFSLRPAPTACLTGSCSWMESVLYQPTGNNDAYAPGNLAFDPAGNLYGTSGSGGAYEYGAVFELTPSSGGWKENIIYSFPGGSSGSGPNSLLLGKDGNLYGTASQGGVVFQLVPSGGAWTENVIYTDVCATNLVQDNFGNLYGLCTVYGQQGISVEVFMLSPSNGSWVFSVLYTAPYLLYDVYETSDLAIDAAGNYVYVAIGPWATFRHAAPHSPGGGTDPWPGAVLVGSFRGFDDWWYSGDVEFTPVGPLAIDANGIVYGTTFDCGANGAGTVWKVY